MNNARHRYRKLYGRLLRLYPKPYLERFGESMEQTFDDLLRERRESGRRTLGFAVGMYLETSAAIVRENSGSIMRNKNIIRIAVVTILFLLGPLVAMQFTDEVNWKPGDFVVAGALLFGAGLGYELVAKRMSNGAYRAAVGVAVATALMLVWANLAVGIIGSEDNPANLMYFAVVAVGIIGAVIARLQPLGMARALFATAAAQMLVVVVVLIAGRHRPMGSSVAEILVANGFFIALFVVSALLFQRASASRQI